MALRMIPLAWLALVIAAAAAATAPAPAQADKLKELIKTPGIIEVKLIEAQVPDLDPLPMQRDSDVFVRIYLNDTKELLCESQIIQDDNKPKVSPRRPTLIQAGARIGGCCARSARPSPIQLEFPRQI